MKKILLVFTLCCSFLMINVFAKPIRPLDLCHLVPDAAFTWDVTTFDFGKIKQNEPVSHTFTFVNTGDSPLVISSVKASCGCTVTQYSKDPVSPGGEGFVKATYNAASIGVFTKTVTVNANAGEGAVQLFVKGEVVE